MLENNSDRTWWMIGAVIVGGLLIVAAKVAFPEVFNMVIEWFKSQIGSFSS